MSGSTLGAICNDIGFKDNSVLVVHLRQPGWSSGYPENS